MIKELPNQENQHQFKKAFKFKDYVLTSNQKKIQLIDLVIKNGYSMVLASEISGVKHSTVKYIIKSYKTDKKSFMKKLLSKKNKTQPIRDANSQIKTEKEQIHVHQNLPQQRHIEQKRMNSAIIDQEKRYFQNGVFEQNYFMAFQSHLCQMRAINPYFGYSYFY